MCRHLPRIGSISLRASQTVARRIVHLYALIGLTVREVDGSAIRDWLVEHSLWDSLEDKERDFLARPDQLTGRQTIDLSWMQESIYTLCWAGELVLELPFPDAEIDIQGLFPLIPPAVAPPVFLERFQLRPRRDIMYTLDLYYHLHHAVRSGNAPGVSVSVVVERRRALEWLTSAEPWYQVSLDT